MFKIYFAYTILIALAMLLECIKKEHPKWWAAMVLVAPVTTPWFILKSRKEEGITLLMIFLATFSAVGGAEFFLYTRYMETNRYSDLPPVTRQMIKLAEDVKKSTIEFDKVLIQLETMSKVESQINKIEETLKFISKVRKVELENKKAIDTLVKYAHDYKQYFMKKDLAWILNIQNFYDNHIIIKHYKTLQSYLDSFESLLEYTFANFYSIKNQTAREYLDNYDEYYLRYRRAVDSHNKFNVKRIQYQNQFLDKHPEIKPYLPGQRQTDSLKLWG